MKKRWFVLSAKHAMLYYFRRKGDEQPIGWIPLENLSILEDKKNPDVGFILASTTGVIKSVKLTDGKTKQGNHRSFVMLAPDTDQRDLWVEALKSHIQRNPFRSEVWKRKQQALQEKNKSR